ncbi:hypothetical protein VTJ83DRAFT_1681 [Remersonia thermophila]|uniref:Cenp-O kinetochore centromere component n=1 Tax=Remersonia thermophila TaxID=72144 RepID=A0ABR4DGL1_9PEZI
MAASLDEEIEELQAKVASLKKQLSTHMTTLLTAKSTRQMLLAEPPPPTTTLTLPRRTSASPVAIDEATKLKLLDQSDLQLAHNQECLYRACATVTTFRARDPDPRAVDGGAILGLRIDVVSRSKFLRPYYVFFNRPYSGAYAGRYLRVHRHTLPPCIPLAGLAARHLPAPPKEDAAGPAKQQDLARFAHALRREVVRYHHRLGVVADLRKAAGLAARRRGRRRRKDAKGEDDGHDDDDNDDGDDDVGEEDVEDHDKAPAALTQLIDISPADAEAKQLTLEWADGRVGRLVMDDDGEIVNLVVLGENGRDREAGRDLLGRATRVEDVVRRLAALG